MKTEDLAKNLKECFKEAEKEDKKGNKHKGLLFIQSDMKTAKSYIKKAKENLELCDIYKEKKIDYKIPEEWFYTLYYCALAILSKFGIESRSQKWTAQFLAYAKLRGSIDYENEFIDMITVHRERSKESEVDKREEARYSSKIRINDVSTRYDAMTLLCKKAISQAEEIVFSNKEFKILKELGF